MNDQQIKAFEAVIKRHYNEKYIGVADFMSEALGEDNGPLEIAYEYLTKSLASKDGQLTETDYAEVGKAIINQCLSHAKTTASDELESCSNIYADDKASHADSLRKEQLEAA